MSRGQVILDLLYIRYAGDFHIGFLFCSDYNTEVDFLELPSQAVENLAWDTDILRDLSGHYITGEPLPEHLMEALQRSRHSNLGTSSLRQIALAMYDLAVHNGLSVSGYFQMRSEVRKVVPPPHPHVYL